MGDNRYIEPMTPHRALTIAKMYIDGAAYNETRRTGHRGQYARELCQVQSVLTALLRSRKLSDFATFNDKNEVVR